MWNFLTITISVSDGQLYDYKQLPSNTKIGGPTKTDRYCKVCQGYLPFSSLVWWYVILIVIIKILKILKLYIPLSESPHFPDGGIQLQLPLIWEWVRYKMTENTPYHIHHLLTNSLYFSMSISSTFLIPSPVDPIRSLYPLQIFSILLAVTMSPPLILCVLLTDLSNLFLILLTHIIQSLDFSFVLVYSSMTWNASP